MICVHCTFSVRVLHISIQISICVVCMRIYCMCDVHTLYTNTHVYILIYSHMYTMCYTTDIIILILATTCPTTASPQPVPLSRRCPKPLLLPSTTPLTLVVTVAILILTVVTLTILTTVIV